ncbi:universal stress protein [Bythopirellula goksoeyrii]|uniref:UspA domain-containing protein n=1 Tax=Bythopirellula goksoeyrii TaxID=1400387 RepID=A0A5B9Q876_9BACT|nr:universal stress protein [Bythopirellula goksoeyrii]QEG33775.1 hypothetical protein Pr1d_10450 [Bythopirellula goksoeyrii]
MVKLHPKRVLIPTDFSEQANRAVDDGLAMVEDPEHLIVLHVAPALSSFSEGDPLVGWNMISDEDRTKYLLEMLRKKFTDEKYKKVHFIISYGTPAEEITQVAKNENCDMIVLPSHGRTGLARLLIGSVAERVVRLAHCPVLVLRD